MSLGENIYRLRTAKNMSQGDLAEALAVSRQSISKWETDSAIPELDKLVKLSELFGVTLDELVTGKPPEREESPKIEPPTQVIVERQGTPVRTAVGIILLCLAFAVVLLFTVAGGLLAGLVYGFPFLLCGVICLKAQTHPALWCAWALFLMVDVFFRFASGLNWAAVLLTLRWTEQMNYARLAVAWGLFLCGLGVLTATVIRLRKGTIEWTKRNKTLFAVGIAAFALLCLPFGTWLFQAGGLNVAVLVTFIDWLRDALRLALLAALLTVAIRGKKR